MVPVITFPEGWKPAVRQTPSTEAIAQVQCATPTDPRQTVAPLRSFGKLQEEKPMDIFQRIQWKYSFEETGDSDVEPWCKDLDSG